MSESVKVAVRCRPMSVNELQQGCRNVVTIDTVAKSCTLENPLDGGGGGGKMFQFDAVFDTSTSTEVVYDSVGSVVVEAVLEGYNGTVFAYGQTGCGKSFTMRGVVERSLEHLFEATSTSSSETRYLALLSYLEIYNERLRDLLQDGDGIEGANLLQLKEDPTRGTYVAGGLREVTVKDAAECSRLLDLGDRKRAAAATKMNAASSRSHAVLTLALEAIAINDKQNSAVRKGMLHLVDLAGSERQGRTGATGERLKEAASINLSLSALGNVISALAAGNGRHVPYRDSKLTRLLRDSLGGNARTVMIACVSPSDIDADETLSTLRYAARARCIKNKPVVNEDPKDALLRQYQLELQRLRKLLESSDNPSADLLNGSIPIDFRNSGKNQGIESEGTGDQTSRRLAFEEEVQRLRKECADSNLSAQKLQEELENLRLRYESSQQPRRPEEEDDQRRRQREAAKNEVMKRLEKLTIGGEARGDLEAKRRRERRRKRLEALAGALEGTGESAEGAVEIYGQLKSTEEALRRAARRVRQLEAETADLQASWDAERRDLLRRELLATQLCDAMIPHLRPGCPFRNIEAVRDAATWCEELSRWRIPDLSPGIPLLPPALGSLQTPSRSQESATTNSRNAKPDHNNNDNNNGMSDLKPQDIADAYFRRSRIDAILAHAREAKILGDRSFKQSSAFVGRQSKSGGSGDNISGMNGYLQLNALNLQSSAPAIGDSLDHALKLSSIHAWDNNTTTTTARNNWLSEEESGKMDAHGANGPEMKKIPPRILEALPSYPLRRIKLATSPVAVYSPRGELDPNHHLRHARSPTYY